MHPSPANPTHAHRLTRSASREWDESSARREAELRAAQSKADREGTSVDVLDYKNVRLAVVHPAQPRLAPARCTPHVGATLLSRELRDAPESARRALLQKRGEAIVSVVDELCAGLGRLDWLGADHPAILALRSALAQLDDERRAYFDAAEVE